MGITHHKITPYWPEVNGCAERFMCTIGKVCKCVQLEHNDLKTLLMNNYMPKRLKVAECFRFHNAKQLPDQSVSENAAHHKKLAST